MLDPYSRAYYVDSLTNNKVSPLKTRKTITSRPRKKTSKQHKDDYQQSTALKTPPPSPSHPMKKSKRLDKRIPKTIIKNNPLVVNNPHHHHHHHHQHHHQHHHHHHRHHSHHRQYKDRRPSLTSSTFPPHDPRYKFNKELIDTFCFHWPAMHCYVLVRVLPSTIAILPIRTRLAFLYFCHAPRPHHPTPLQQQQQQQRQNHHQQQRRIQSMFKPWRHTLAFNSDEDEVEKDKDENENEEDEEEDEEDEEDQDVEKEKAVTLADVLKDHRMDVGWIHAPCRLKSSSQESPLLTLRSRCSTLELKARCISEKNSFIQLFYWNKRQQQQQRRQQRKQQRRLGKSQQTHIGVNEILIELERQNQDLQHAIDALITQMNQRQTDILTLEHQNLTLDDQMDILCTALDRTREHQNELNDNKEAQVAMDLRKHMDAFLDTHQRVMQRHRGQGSFAWVIDHSFQRLHRFQDRHASGRHGGYLGTTLLVLVFALVLAYFSL